MAKSWLAPAGCSTDWTIVPFSGLPFTSFMHNCRVVKELAVVVGVGVGVAVVDGLEVVVGADVGVGVVVGDGTTVIGTVF